MYVRFSVILVMYVMLPCYVVFGECIRPIRSGFAGRDAWIAVYRCE